MPAWAIMHPKDYHTPKLNPERSPSHWLHFPKEQTKIILRMLACTRKETAYTTGVKHVFDAFFTMEQFFFSFLFGTAVANCHYQTSPSKGMYPKYQQTGYFRKEGKKKWKKNPQRHSLSSIFKGTQTPGISAEVAQG